MMKRIIYWLFKLEKIGKELGDGIIISNYEYGDRSEGIDAEQKQQKDHAPLQTAVPRENEFVKERDSSPKMQIQI